MKGAVEIGGVCLRKLYEGRFRTDMVSEVQKIIVDFLRSEAMTSLMKPIVECDEIWIKPNLTNPRPPETGCITHPVAVNALLEYLLDYLQIRRPVRIVETITYHKGAGMPEVLARLPDRERSAIEDKIKHKDPGQDMHDFGFALLLELSGIGEIVRKRQDRGQDLEILNLSKEPVMSQEEERGLTRKVEELLGAGAMPEKQIRIKIGKNLPKVLQAGNVGLISLTLPKTHDEPQAWMTGSIKNLALGLYPRYKAFMHKDLARAMIYHYAFWKIGLKDNIIGMFCGPLGQDREGPIFGRTVDFPYVVAGRDLLKLDALVVALCSGKPDLIERLNTFKFGAKKIGEVPRAEEVREILPYSLMYQPYPYTSLPCCSEA